MSNRLITTSLLDSISWAKNAPDKPSRDDPEVTWKQKAYNDMVKTLSRIWTTPEPWLQRGIDFENKVYQLTAKGVDTEALECSPHFRFFLQESQGATVQKKTKSFLQIDGEEYCLFGKLDLWFPDKIKDIKTTKSYGGQAKYLGTMQHKIYCLNEKIKNFEYLIAEFSEDPKDMEIKNVYRVPYTVEDFGAIRDEIIAAIRGAMEFLQMFDGEGDLWDLYLNKYCMKW